MSEESEVAEVNDDFTIESGNVALKHNFTIESGNVALKHNYENVSISEGQVSFQSILKIPRYQIRKLDFPLSEY